MRRFSMAYFYKERQVGPPFEVLCGGNIKWVSTTTENIPWNAVIGGKTVKGETLYIGRALFDGALTVGNVHKSHGVLLIGYSGKEISFKTFELLTEFYGSNRDLCGFPVATENLRRITVNCVYLFDFHGYHNRKKINDLNKYSMCFFLCALLFHYYIE